MMFKLRNYLLIYSIAYYAFVWTINAYSVLEFHLRFTKAAVNSDTDRFSHYPKNALSGLR